MLVNFIPEHCITPCKRSLLTTDTEPIRAVSFVKAKQCQSLSRVSSSPLSRLLDKTDRAWVWKQSKSDSVYPEGSEIRQVFSLFSFFFFIGIYQK